jgi:hypothetical protein
MTSGCIESNGHDEKHTQTNAVFFRTGRFDALASDTWWSLADRDANGSCTTSTQDRALNLRVKLHDKISNKDVTVQSVHWPTTASGGGSACADENIDKTVDMSTSGGTFGGNLRIIGMDANATDLTTPGSTSSTFRSWYKKVNGQITGSSYKYRDAIYSACGGSKSCLINNWTNTSPRRIDYLLANKYTGLLGGAMPTMTNGHTVTYNEGDAADLAVTGADRDDLDYSQHRAVWAYINY